MSEVLPTLRLGDRGEAVVKLQAALPKLVQSGIFDTATDHAVQVFQVENGLIMDGVVGPRTWAALLQKPTQVAENNPKTALLGNQRVNISALIASIPYPSVRENAHNSIPIILQACGEYEVTDKYQIAYVLATAEHESHLGQWMEEFASGWEYEGRVDLGNTQPGDGVRFKGRGFVQLTGRRNYQDWSERLGIDLIDDPLRVADFTVGAKILVGGMKLGSFTGHKLDDYLGTNFFESRRIVNGMDCAARISAIARSYLSVLEKTDDKEF
jgi:peptidoglycan hydrolase-like protein with peptidoglycan-binding domain